MAYTPSPAILAVTVDPTGNETTDEGIDNVRKVDRSVDESSPLERGDVGNNQTID
jgi:hypothetical protein